MTDKEKIQLADIVLRYLEDIKENKSIPVQIGTLKKAQGIKGFKLAEIGNPVYEYEDRYIIYMESIDGKTVVDTRYYKETLGPIIEMI